MPQSYTFSQYLKMAVRINESWQVPIAIGRSWQLAKRKLAVGKKKVGSWQVPIAIGKLAVGRKKLAVGKLAV
jgi:hypothetical protein